MPRYPKDDDWGDWALEARRAKELDRRLDAEPCSKCAGTERVWKHTQDGLVRDWCDRCGAADRHWGRP